MTSEAGPQKRDGYVSTSSVVERQSNFGHWHFLTIFDAHNYETHNAEQNPHLKSYDLFKMVSERFEIQQQISLGFQGGASGKEPAFQRRRHELWDRVAKSRT